MSTAGSYDFFAADRSNRAETSALVRGAAGRVVVGVLTSVISPCVIG
jgi:hypothetical protein